MSTKIFSKEILMTKLASFPSSFGLRHVVNLTESYIIFHVTCAQREILKT